MNNELPKLVAANKLDELVAKLSDPAYREAAESGRCFRLPRTFTAPKDLLQNDDVSLLHIAAYFDCFEIFLYLISIGLELRVLSGQCYWPLHYACWGQAIECTAYILEQDPTQATDDHECQWQPLFLAVFANAPDILEMLFERGVDLKNPRIVENHPFQQAIRSSSMECLLILLQHRCKTDVQVTGMSPLMLAVASRMGAALKPLLDLGLDPSFVRPTTGETVLALACQQGDVAAVQLLCERMDTIEIPASDERHSSIARFAVASKNLDILKMVLKKGTDIDLNRYDHADDQPADAIRGAVDDELGVKMVEVLIEHGFNIQLRSPKTQKTFLDRLVEYTVGCYPKSLQLLLKKLIELEPELATDDAYRALFVRVHSWKGTRYANNTQLKYWSIFRSFFPAQFPEE
jgi:ankyrin repeat protein